MEPGFKRLFQIIIVVMHEMQYIKVEITNPIILKLYMYSCRFFYFLSKRGRKWNLRKDFRQGNPLIDYKRKDVSGCNKAVVGYYDVLQWHPKHGTVNFNVLLLWLWTL